MSGPAGDIIDEAYAKSKGKSYGTPQGGVMCSGPYKLMSWVPGQKITLSANDSYWDPALRPKTKCVTLLFDSNSSNVIQALKSGSIDGAY